MPLAATLMVFLLSALIANPSRAGQSVRSICLQEKETLNALATETVNIMFFAYISPY